MKNVRKINLIYLFAFFGDALFSPFIALYLISKGFSDYQRGFLLAIIPFLTILGNLIYGKFSSKLKKNLMLVKILACINSLVIILYGLVSNYYLLIGLTVLFGLHNSPYFSMQDGVGVNLCEQEKKIYSRTRMFGSLGYCIALLLGSFLVLKINYTLLFIIAGFFFLLVNLVSLFIKLPNEEQEEIKVEKVSYKELFKNNKYLLYCLFYILVNGIWVIGESYVSTYFNYLGITDSQFSLMCAIQVGVEIVTIFIISKMKNNDKYLKTILLSSCIVNFSRYILMGFNINYLVIYISSAVLRGIGWGGFLSSHLLIVKKIVGINLTTKAITFLAIIANTLGSLGSLVAPYIYTSLSLQWLYLIFGLIQMVGTCVLLFINIKTKEEGKYE